jgi:hypothetical protein
MCPDEHYRNIEFSFSYALPYVYSDLLLDLDKAKKALMEAGGKLTNQASKYESYQNYSNVRSGIETKRND